MSVDRFNAEVHVTGPDAPAAKPEIQAKGQPAGSNTANPGLAIKPTEPADVGERPAWLPAKYKTPEEFAAAHQELERKLGAPAKPAEAPPAGTPPAAPAGFKPVARATLEALSAEFTEKGALTAESYAKLESEHGLTRDIVDDYIDGQVERGRALVRTAYEVAGGEEQYQAMAAWASENLDAATLTRLNAELSSRDPARVKFATETLKLRYASADPTRAPSRRVQGERAGGVAPFRSQAEIQQAMRDPRYDTDEAYRQDVERRMEASG